MRGHEFNCQQYPETNGMNTSFSNCIPELLFTDIGKHLFKAEQAVIFKPVNFQCCIMVAFQLGAQEMWYC